MSVRGNNEEADEVCVSDDVFLGVVKESGLLVSLRPTDKRASRLAQMYV